MRNTAPHGSKSRNEAVAKLKAYDLGQRIAMMLNPFKPAGTLPRWKRGKQRMFGHISGHP